MTSDNTTLPDTSPAAVLAMTRNLRTNGYELAARMMEAIVAGAPAAPVSTEINPDECDSEVYKRGTSVGLFAIPKEDANAICAGIAAATGARVDWHYIAGRVHIKALPAPAPAAGDALDAARYRWLTEDHADPVVRKHRNDILRRMSVMSHSAASADIDAAIAAQRQGDA